MNEKIKSVLIIPAGGVGKRTGIGFPKQFYNLKGIPIIVRTVRLFNSIEEVESIVISIHKEWLSFAKEMFEKFDCPKVKEIVAGGESRQESVYKALQSRFVEESDMVLVHDSVRPFVDTKLIRTLIDQSMSSGAVIPTIPLKDSIKEVNNNRVIKTIDRTKFQSVQTPQVFKKEIIIEAYNRSAKSNIVATDCAFLVESAGYTVTTVLGSELNFKITTDIDLRLAELFLDDERTLY